MSKVPFLTALILLSPFINTLQANAVTATGTGTGTGTKSTFVCESMLTNLKYNGLVPLLIRINLDCDQAHAPANY